MVDVAERSSQYRRPHGWFYGSAAVLAHAGCRLAAAATAATIDYLKAENRMLRARLGGRRIIFTDAERRQLAEKARALGRKGLRELGTIA